MVYDKTPLRAEQADAILTKWLGRAVHCESMTRLHGGMVNSVLRLDFDADPFRAVVKLSGRTGEETFQGEAAALRYLRAEAAFPVPRVLLCESDGETVPLSFLLLEFMPGRNLGEAGVGGAARADLDRQMAEVLARLHEHYRSTFGRAVRPEAEGTAGWLGFFEPMIRDNHESIEGRIEPVVWARTGRVLDRLDVLLPAEGAPTLVHGDIWATNVMVERVGARWDLVGFVDPGALYADVEYELAYLEVFSTVTDAFFDAYTHYHAPRPGYELRRLVYWLNTMMLHVDHFGDAHYVRNTEELARALGGALGV